MAMIMTFIINNSGSFSSLIYCINGFFSPLIDDISQAVRGAARKIAPEILVATAKPQKKEAKNKCFLFLSSKKRRLS